MTGDGKLPIETPRDRAGSFERVLIPKHARRFTDFDDKVIALYARGLTVREIREFLLETYADHQHGPTACRQRSSPVRRDGTREILGIWIETTKDAKFWLKVFDELKNRGVGDILIVVTEGLNGMEQALLRRSRRPHGEPASCI